jgi:hypothetical protein
MYKNFHTGIHTIGLKNMCDKGKIRKNLGAGSRIIAGTRLWVVPSLGEETVFLMSLIKESGNPSQSCKEPSRYSGHTLDEIHA